MQPESRKYLYDIRTAARRIAEFTQGQDYERFAGRRAKVWTTEPVENTKYLEGRLRGYADGIVQIEVKDHVVGVPFAGIRKAQLVVEF